MNTLSDYDQRQLNLMLKQLDFFKNKNLEFRLLVIHLESLLHVMEHFNNEWEEKFLDEFSTLESINAEMPEMKKDEIDTLVNQAVFNLTELIKHKLNEFKK